MSKAERLLELATMVAARHQGVTLAEVEDRFDVSKRTAQRMLRNMEGLFPDTTTNVDEMGHKRWHLSQGALKQFLTITSDELAAFDFATEAVKRSGALAEAQHLRSFREKILTLVPRAISTRLEPDHEALLEAQDFVARPGPKPRLNVEVSKALADAIKAGRALHITYQTRFGADLLKRDIIPYGIITGLRRYVVARTLDEDPTTPPKLYVVENIQAARVLDQLGLRPDGFDLQMFCRRSFGVFQNEAEISDVVLRFNPASADRARQFEFHPTQTMEDEPDGSLVVRFTASGILEMTWHLYTWGANVEVLSPPVLCQMVNPYRRSDFASLP